MDIEKQTEVNQKLYQKISDEVAIYRQSLLKMKPEEYLAMAYKYSVYMDILYIMEHNQLPIEKAEVLLSSEHPIEDIWNQWQRYPSDRSEELWCAIELTAHSKISAERFARNWKSKQVGEAR